jgi:hypothetical protein
MLQIETFSSEDEENLTKQMNYFLKQLEENMVREIKFSSNAFFVNSQQTKIVFCGMIVYFVR